MEFWKEVFAGGSGQASWMRVVSTPVVIAGIFVAVYAVVTGTVDAAIIGLVLSMMGPVLGAKVLQRKYETGANTEEGS
jgi:hypothetical protein